MIVEQHRLAVRGRFRHPDIARYDRLIDLVAEHAAHILRNLFGQAELRRSNMVRTTPCMDSLGLRLALHPLDGLEQLAQALEREEFALQRHQHGIGGRRAH